MKYDSLMLVIAVIAVIFIAGCSQLPTQNTVSAKKFSSEAEMKAFLDDNMNSGSSGYYGASGGAMRAMAGAETTGAQTMSVTQNAAAPKAADTSLASGTADHSTTNIQVAGVDEADIIKSDGRYMYIISGQNLVIVDAYPGENARIVSTTNLSGTASALYVNGDRVIVFGSAYDEVPSSGQSVGSGGSSSSGSTASGSVGSASGSAVSGAGSAGDAKVAAGVSPDIAIMPPYPYPTYKYYMFIKTYDVSDRTSPKIMRDLKLEGNYYDSRMIGDYVYVIMNEPVQYNGGPIILPMMYERGIGRPLFGYTDVMYFNDPDSSYQYTDVISLNIQNEDPISNNPFLLGYTQNLYVSQNSIYTTGAKQVKQTDIFARTLNDVILPLIPQEIKDKIASVQGLGISANAKMVEIESILSDYNNKLNITQRNDLQTQMQDRYDAAMASIQKEMQKTVIHKIDINNGAVEYKATGEVPGSPLNQFSMDESKGYFRIATTVQGTWTSKGETPSFNNVYVLDSDLKQTGMIEDIAPGESIYSARFMGDRAYLVTFMRVDPLFVLDLSDPSNPTILGKLKIPGYSDYLQPYDETHLIGIGKDVNESIDSNLVHEANAVYYTAVQGVKLALFDVSDVNNPIEMANYVIGDRGTDSLALTDHKAVLFDKSKNLLVIPILLAENKNKTSDYVGDFTFQGAYVFDLTLENGFVLKGRITHVTDASLEKSGYYYYSPYSVKRSLYIGNYLYTLSDEMLKVNNLQDLTPVAQVDLPYTDSYYGPYYGGGIIAKPMMAVE